MNKSTSGAAIVLAAILAAPMAQAQAPASAQSQLSIGEIIAKLESAGYTSVTDIEKDDGVWEVDAINPAGERVELDVDPVNGTVVREKADD